MADRDQKLRLFTAIGLSDSLRKRLGALVDNLRDSIPGARWVRAENLHVTLVFLGDVNASDVPAICEALRRVAESLPAWNVRVRSLGSFPSPQRPRVLWAGLQGGEDLFGTLYAQLAEALAPYGEKAETRAYTPHITLARFRGRPPAELPGIVQKYVSKDWGELGIGALTLFESRLAPKGAAYAPLYKVRFQVCK